MRICFSLEYFLMATKLLENERNVSDKKSTLAEITMVKISS